jgi:hypothetical protein
MTAVQNGIEALQSSGGGILVKRRSWLARRFLQLAFVLFSIGILATILAVWGQQRAAAKATWRDPAESLEAPSVASDLAALNLAGVPDAQVLVLAMEKGELATAHALLALSAGLTDAQRVSGWLWLADRYQDTGQTERAALAFRLAGSGAVLGQDLTDLLRTDALVAVGQGLLALHDQVSARHFLSQAAAIGAHASDLSDYHRRSLLERLLPALVRSGGQRDDWLALAKAVKASVPGAGRFSIGGGSGTSDWRDSEPDGDAALVNARNARREAAAGWLDAISNGADADTLVQVQRVLRETLAAEDAAVDRYWENQGRMRITAPGASKTRLRWLLLKRQIASGGLGADVMPDWEADREAIDAALSSAWADWMVQQATPPFSAPPVDFQNLPAQVARQAISAAYWGLYPNAPVTDLVKAAQSGGGSDRLRLTVLKPGTPPTVGWSE